MKAIWRPSRDDWTGFGTDVGLDEEGLAAAEVEVELGEKESKLALFETGFFDTPLNDQNGCGVVVCEELLVPFGVSMDEKFALESPPDAKIEPEVAGP
jgi:hypothetical protein